MSLSRSASFVRHLVVTVIAALSLGGLCGGGGLSAQTSPAVPLAGTPILRNYTLKEIDGGPQTWAVIQDGRGLMYFGNSSGTLLQFDGVTWKKIFASNTTSVRSLQTDDTGRIWVGAYADFGYLIPDATGSMQYVSILDKVPAGDREFTDVWQVVATPEGIYFRSYSELSGVTASR